MRSTNVLDSPVARHKRGAVCWAGVARFDVESRHASPFLSQEDQQGGIRDHKSTEDSSRQLALGVSTARVLLLSRDISWWEAIYILYCKTRCFRLAPMATTGKPPCWVEKRALLSGRLMRRVRSILLVKTAAPTSLLLGDLIKPDILLPSV